MPTGWRALTVGVALGLALGSCSSSDDAAPAAPETPPVVLTPVILDPPQLATATPDPNPVRSERLVQELMSDTNDEVGAQGPGYAIYMMRAFEAYEAGYIGTDRRVAFLSTSLATATRDLRPDPNVSDRDTARGAVYTFGSPQLVLPADLVLDGVVENGRTFIADPWFDFRTERATELDEDDEPQPADNFYGAELNILEDYRQQGTGAAIMAAGAVNFDPDDAGNGRFGVAPHAGLLSWPVENFYWQYCWFLDLEAAANDDDPECPGRDQRQHSERAKKFRRVLYGQVLHEAARQAADADNPFPGADVIFVQFTTDELRDAVDNPVERYRDLADALLQADIAAADRVPVVLPAGDYSLDEPGLPASLPLVVPEIGRHVLVVSAITQLPDIDRTREAVPGEVSEFSLLPGANKCGYARTYCLVAPGQNLRTVELRFVRPAAPNAPATLYDRRTQNNTNTFSGTVYAAGLAAGALAVLDHAFPTLSGADLVTRLLATATTDFTACPDNLDPCPFNDNPGAFGDGNSEVFGQGLIDLGAAILPQGRSAMALTGMARGAAAPLDASALVLRSALLGDALQRAFAGQSFVALDELHSPFRHPLNSLLRARQPFGSRLEVAAPLQRSVRRLAGGGLLHIDRGADRSVSLALRRGALGMHLASDTHPGLGFGSVAEGSGLARTGALQADSALFAPWAASDRRWHGFGAEVALGNSQRLSLSRYRALGRDDTDSQLAESDGGAQDAVALSWQADFAGGRFGLQQVRSRSADQLLGIEASGGLGGIADGRVDAANGWGLIELSARSRLLFSLWQLRARADNLAQGALASVDGLTADSWALALMLSGAANTDLSLRLEQPLRARSGSLHFQVPTAHTKARRILFAPLAADAAPSGRELRVQADLSIRLGERGGRLQLSAGQAREPGHIRGAGNDPYALLSLSLPL